MKRWMITLLFATICTVASWAQAQKTFVKSVALNGQTHAVASFGGNNVTSSKWDNNYLRVTVTVEVTNFNEDILKRLVEVGRYNIEVVEQGGSLYLTMPKIKTPVSIQGKSLEEKIHYEISLPKNVTLDIEGQQETAVGSLK